MGLNRGWIRPWAAFRSAGTGPLTLAAAAACLEQHQCERPSREGPLVAFSAAHGILEEQEALKIGPAKAGDAEVRGGAVRANHWIEGPLFALFTPPNYIRFEPTTNSVRPASVYRLC
jgi:hypothetical protein